MGFPGRWDGTIEQALPIMDKVGIATTMIVPLNADAKLLAERMEGEAKRAGKRYAGVAGVRHLEVSRVAIGGNFTRLSKSWSGTQIHPSPVRSRARLSARAWSRSALPSTQAFIDVDVWDKVELAGMLISEGHKFTVAELDTAIPT